MSELLPCPFCGEAKTFKGIQLYWCSCTVCHAEGTTKYIEAEAIAAWNTRAEQTCKNKAPRYLDFLCSECGFVHYIDDSNCTGDGNEWNYCPNCGRKVVDDGIS